MFKLFQMRDEKCGYSQNTLPRFLKIGQIPPEFSERSYTPLDILKVTQKDSKFLQNGTEGEILFLIKLNPTVLQLDLVKFRLNLA